jgi:hypothetical protein
MTEIRLLAVPYEVGGLRMGVGRGPERLMEAGAQQGLGSEGAKVSAQLTSQVRSLLDARPVRAVSLTAYDPECDAERKVQPIAMGLLEAVAVHAGRDR